MASPRKPTFPPNFVLVAVSVAVSGLFSSACDKSEACQATVTLDGKSGKGSGPDEATAKKLAWVDYCVRHDPTVDGKYRVYRALGGKGGGKKAEVIENVSALKKIRQLCEKRSAAAPKARVEATCKD